MSKVNLHHYVKKIDPNNYKKIILRPPSEELLDDENKKYTWIILKNKINDSKWYFKECFYKHAKEGIFEDVKGPYENYEHFLTVKDFTRKEFLEFYENL